jgi:hypothetical protein
LVIVCLRQFLSAVVPALVAMDSFVHQPAFASQRLCQPAPAVQTAQMGRPAVFRVSVYLVRCQHAAQSRPAKLRSPARVAFVFLPSPTLAATQTAASQDSLAAHWDSVFQVLFLSVSLARPTVARASFVLVKVCACPTILRGAQIHSLALLASLVASRMSASPTFCLSAMLRVDVVQDIPAVLRASAFPTFLTLATRLLTAIEAISAAHQVSAFLILLPTFVRTQKTALASWFAALSDAASPILSAVARSTQTALQASPVPWEAYVSQTPWMLARNQAYAAQVLSVLLPVSAHRILSLYARPQKTAPLERFAAAPASASLTTLTSVLMMTIAWLVYSVVTWAPASLILISSATPTTIVREETSVEKPVFAFQSLTLTVKTMEIASRVLCAPSRVSACPRCLDTAAPSSSARESMCATC